MIRLFDVFPRLENERLLLREWVGSDASALSQLVRNPLVCRYLPTILYEQSIDNTEEMIERARSECFDTKNSILLGICIKPATDRLIGIAEIYNYEAIKEKASIGYRLYPDVWGKGIATGTTALMKNYLLEHTDVRKITAHVMAENTASSRVLEKNGFVLRWTGLREDWGRSEPVLVNKYMFKLSPEENQAICLCSE